MMAGESLAQHRDSPDTHPSAAAHGGVTDRMTTQTATGRHARTHLRIERVQVQPRWLSILSPFILIILSLLVGAVLLRIIGADPWFVYRRMGNLAFGSLYGWSDTTIKATPLILAALGVSIAFRMRLWNIGAEGQLMIGAFFATGVALYVLPSNTPAFFMLDGHGHRRLHRRRALGLHSRRAESQTQRQRNHHDVDAQLRRHSVEQLFHLRPVERTRLRPDAHLPAQRLAAPLHRLRRRRPATARAHRPFRHLSRHRPGDRACPSSGDAPNGASKSASSATTPRRLATPASAWPATSCSSWRSAADSPASPA